MWAFELIVGLFICCAILKASMAMNRNGLVWFGITFVLCLVSLVIPIPILNLCLAGIVSFVSLLIIDARDPTKL